MSNLIPNFPLPINEHVNDYLPNSKERTLLKNEIAKLENEFYEIPLIIGGKEIRTGNFGDCIQPHKHSHKLGKFHKASTKEVEMAIEASQKAKKEWESMDFSMRASIFMKAAELLSKKYRYLLNAATMLGQSKNPFQAEIDSACELIDFWRFNTFYMKELYQEQPFYPGEGIWNYTEHRALEGFVFAVTPFNFTAIAGNLPTAPAMMGNTVVWKPASTAVYSGYFIMKILQEAGLPEGVINFVPGSGSQVGNPVLESPHFSGIHFTGSTGVFQHMWKTIGNNITKYKTYPRIVGETGGKDFIFAHSSADKDALVAALIRGSFEYQGQKCSAASRAYIPASIWDYVKEKLVDEIKTLKMGPVQDFSNFVNAVIDKSSFENIKSYLNYAKESNEAEIIAGGNCDDSEGYFVEPTVILTTNPHFKSMEEEIFGPVMTIFVYQDEDFEKTLEICDNTSIYALTGAIFAQDRKIINYAFNKLRHSAGNFYINDKPTGAVVGQQPFGGSRGSGTNDKAGAKINLSRWTSIRSIKETFNPVTNYRYPFLSE